MQLQVISTTTSLESKDNNNRQLQKQMALDSLKAQPTGDIYDIDVEAFSMSAEHLKPEILGKVIDNLAQIYNKKTGQKIKVVFRKMIEDDSRSSGTTTAATTAKEKKYQLTLDKVKQRKKSSIIGQ